MSFRHPVTPDHLATVIARAGEAAQRLLLCTDFDGSLAPIVREPSKARPRNAAMQALLWLSRKGAARGEGATCATRLAVISARDSDDIAARLPLGDEAIIVGNYGLERWTRGHVVIHPSAMPWLPALDQAEEMLGAQLRDGRVPGARLERKRCGLVLHTRGLQRRGVDTEAATLAAEVAERLRLGLVLGKRTVELHIPVRRDKAATVRSLRTGPWATAALCAAGDDHGDVGMLRLASSLGERGVSIAVADREIPTAVLEAAGYRLDGPSAWAACLQGLRRALVSGTGRPGPR